MHNDMYVYTTSTTGTRSPPPVVFAVVELDENVFVGSSNSSYGKCYDFFTFLAEPRRIVSI